MSPDPPRRPIAPLSVNAAPGATQPQRHRTVLTPEPAGTVQAERVALAIADLPARAAALRSVVAAHPGSLDAWARLSEVTLDRGDAVGAYAFARVAYHRGLDKLRREGWGGTGAVAWADPTNRGFLRGLRALLAAAAAIDEHEESSRCRAFLLDLDPDDGLGVAAYPEVPGAGWSPPPLPAD